MSTNQLIDIALKEEGKDEFWFICGFIVADLYKSERRELAGRLHAAAYADDGYPQACEALIEAQQQLRKETDK